jgi:uncharacterized 2Fe-2S/4Fe-4S cluster protein (DUF4445 family)
VPHGTTVLAGGADSLVLISIRSVVAARCVAAVRSMSAPANLPNMGYPRGRTVCAAVTAVETRYADKKGLAEGRRLSCQSTLVSDVVIDVPPESQVHNQLVRKDADDRQIEMDPIIRLCLVEVREPDMHEPSGDLRRLVEALETQWPDRVSGKIDCDLHILQQLQPVLRAGKWQVTVALARWQPIVGIWPGLEGVCCRCRHRCRVNHHVGASVRHGHR